jgi:hypothetical protein
MAHMQGQGPPFVDTHLAPASARETVLRVGHDRDEARRLAA